MNKDWTNIAIKVTTKKNLEDYRWKNRCRSMSDAIEELLKKK